MKYSALSPLSRRFIVIFGLTLLISGCVPPCLKNAPHIEKPHNAGLCANAAAGYRGRGSIPPLIYAKICVCLSRRCPLPLRVEILYPPPRCRFLRLRFRGVAFVVLLPCFIGSAIKEKAAASPLCGFHFRGIARPCQRWAGVPVQRRINTYRIFR